VAFSHKLPVLVDEVPVILMGRGARRRGYARLLGPGAERLGARPWPQSPSSDQTAHGPPPAALRRRLEPSSGRLAPRAASFCRRCLSPGFGLGVEITCRVYRRSVARRLGKGSLPEVSRGVPGRLLLQASTCRHVIRAPPPRGLWAPPHPPAGAGWPSRPPSSPRRGLTLAAPTFAAGRGARAPKRKYLSLATA
jgi:hypothetical protein